MIQNIIEPCDCNVIDLIHHMLLKNIIAQIEQLNIGADGKKKLNKININNESNTGLRGKEKDNNIMIGETGS